MSVGDKIVLSVDPGIAERLDELGRRLGVDRASALSVVVLLGLGLVKVRPEMADWMVSVGGLPR